MPENDPNVEKQLEAPVLWIGMYAAAASSICTLAMAADLCRGFRTRKYWFPSKYFSLNATSLTLLAVAMKLPVDLTTKMYSVTDRLAKVSSLAFISISTANFLTSLGSMDDKSVLMNVVALAILLITITGNVCIQIIQMRSYLSLRRAFWEESTAMALMLALLVMFISSALTILSTKQDLETRYQEMHESSVDNEKSMDMRRKLKALIKKYWVMAQTSSPQFVIARSVTSTVSGIISLLIVVVMVEAEIRIAVKEGVFDRTYSSYKESTRWILVSQTIGVIVGAIAPISRWFVAINYRTSTECAESIRDALEVEEYWTQKLEDWRQGSLSVDIRHLKSRKALHVVKGQFLKLCISAQHLIVQTSKLVVAVSICVARSIKFGLKTQISDSASQDSEVDMRRYAIQLQGEVELPQETLTNIFKELDDIISKGRTRKPKNLLNLLKKSSNFKGVREFDSDLHPQQLPYCWSLPVVTLACIALAIPNVERRKSESLLHSVTEGLKYVKFIDQLVDKNRHLAKIRAAADAVSVEAEVHRSWQNTDLNEISVKGGSSALTLRKLLEDSERTVMKFQRNPFNWPAKAIAANAMYRVSRTILAKQRRGEREEQLFERLSVMIADIIAACLTNLPRAITIKCHLDSIEERERGVRTAAQYLGETEEIIVLLQEREVPVLTPDQAVYIEEWRSSIARENEDSFVAINIQDED